MSTLVARVERGVPVVLHPATITDRFYAYVLTGTPSGVVSQNDGFFSAVLEAGTYEITVREEKRWLVQMPDDPGSYRIADVLLKDISREFVRRDGDSFNGILLLPEPDENSSPRQAATVHYVKKHSLKFKHISLRA